MDAPLTIVLANKEQVAAYTVALDGMLEEIGEDSADYIKGVGYKDGLWVVELIKPISMEWHLGISLAAKAKAQESC